MIRTNIYKETPARKITETKGPFAVLEFDKDLSVTPESAATAYFASQMNVHKRQVIANLDGTGVIVQSGAMQLTMGSVDAATNIKGAGDLLKKAIGSKVTGESAIKPRYSGKGIVVLEPTYKYILLADLADWGGTMVIEDGMFLACEDTVKMSITARSTLSSAVLGNEGLFNTALSGTGVVALESNAPASELIIVDLQDDVLKIDGSMAIAWSSSLKFTVERTTKTLVGSAASGEGFVNVYRGTGRVLLTPVTNIPAMAAPN